MANVSQTITNFLGGINQQADWDKAPGEVRECTNAYPDMVYGLRKRPGLKFEYALDDSLEITDGHWFSIVKEGDPPFLGVIYNNGKVRIWNNATRQECTVNNSLPAYLSENDKDPAGFEDNGSNKYKTLNVNDITILINRKVLVDPQSGNVGPVTGTVTTVAELPETATTDDVYYVTNATSSTDDDFYVKWDGNAWVETYAPDIDSTGFDRSSMPHQIFKVSNTEFTIDTINFVDRQVGNAVTNPQPSFVGNYIEGGFFYLNRLGFLSGANVCMSQPLQPDITAAVKDQPIDFYVNSALTASPADPIDITAASVRSVTLRSVQPSYQGLTLFSDGEQFMLYSDAGVMTPQTATVKSISTFEYEGNVDVQTLRDEYYFISVTQRHTRLHKMKTRGLENGPIIKDVSRSITDYIPNNMTDLVPNSENGFISLSSQGSNIMYMFRRLAQADQEQQLDTWFTWEMPGNIQSCVFYKDKMYIVLHQNGRTTISSLSLNTVSEEDILTNVPVQGSFINPLVGVGPFVDNWISNSTAIKFTVTPTSQYTDSQGQVWLVDPILTFPDEYPHDLTLEPVVIQTEQGLVRGTDWQGSTEEVGWLPPVTNNQDGTWTIKATYKATKNYNWVAGYRYGFDVHLPRYYMRRESGYDYDAYFVLNRMQFAFYEFGTTQFLIKAIGKTDWKEIKPATPANYYNADTSHYLKEVVVSLPLHQRNDNFLLRIYDDSPWSLSLNRMMWEGRYTPKYYTRG